MYSYIISLSIIIFILSCTNSNGPDVPGVNKKGHLSVKFDGEKWYPELKNLGFHTLSSHGLEIEVYDTNSKSYTKSLNFNNFSDQNKYKIILWGRDKSSNGFALEVNDVIGPGEYTIEEIQLDYYKLLNY